MNAAYPKLIKENLPNAKILYDGFHVMKNFTEQVLEEGKRHCIADINSQNRIRYKRKRPGRRSQKDKMTEENTVFSSSVTTKENRHLLVGSQWLLMKRSDDLDINRKEKLDRLIRDNGLLATLYPIVEKLREIWRERNPAKATEVIEETRELLLAVNDKFNFAPAKRFAMMLKRRQEGLVEVGRYGFSTGRLEGMNNKIKVIKRIAYGFHDLEYFYLKIKGAFPGIKNNIWTTITAGTAIIKHKLWNPLTDLKTAVNSPTPDPRLGP